MIISRIRIVTWTWCGAWCTIWWGKRSRSAAPTHPDPPSESWWSWNRAGLGSGTYIQWLVFRKTIQAICNEINKIYAILVCNNLFLHEHRVSFFFAKIYCNFQISSKKIVLNSSCFFRKKKYFQQNGANHRARQSASDGGSGREDEVHWNGQKLQNRQDYGC